MWVGNVLNGYDHLRRNRAPLAVLGAVAQRRYPVGVRRLRCGNGVR